MGVEAERAVLGEVAGGAYELACLDADEVRAAAAVVDRFHDLGIGLADASIVVLADRSRTRSVLTLDRRHFTALRTLDGRRFTLLP